jgi:hypothetical protein
MYFVLIYRIVAWQKNENKKKPIKNIFINELDYKNSTKTKKKNFFYSLPPGYK